MFKLISMKSQSVANNQAKNPITNDGSIRILEITSGPRPELVTLKLKLEFFTGTPLKTSVTTQLHIPKPKSIYKDIDKLEKKSLEWVKQKGLYPGKAFKGIQNTKVAGLVAICYATVAESAETDTEGQEKMETLTKWLQALFAIDDWLDYGTGIEPSKVRLLNDEKRKVLLGKRDIKKSDSKRAVALNELYKNTKAFRNDPYFFASFNRYLQSTHTEAFNEYRNKNVEIDEACEIRRETSGAHHSLAMGCSILGYKTQDLLERFYNFRKMLNFDSDCIGFSNDILSANKEWLKLIKDVTDDPSNVDAKRLETLLKERHTMNLVHLKWKKGAPLDEAMQFVAKKHNDAMMAYYNQKDILQSILKDNDADTQKKMNHVIDILEGWLAHPIWAVLVPRYKVGADICTQNDIANLVKRIQETSTKPEYKADSTNSTDKLEKRRKTVKSKKRRILSKASTGNGTDKPKKRRTLSKASTGNGTDKPKKRRKISIKTDTADRKSKKQPVTTTIDIKESFRKNKTKHLTTYKKYRKHARN